MNNDQWVVVRWVVGAGQEGGSQMYVGGQASDGQAGGDQMKSGQT